MGRGLTSMASQISPKYARNISDGLQVPNDTIRKAK